MSNSKKNTTKANVFVYGGWTMRSDIRVEITNTVIETTLKNLAFGATVHVTGDQRDDHFSSAILGAVADNGDVDVSLHPITCGKKKEDANVAVKARNELLAKALADTGDAVALIFFKGDNPNGKANAYAKSIAIAMQQAGVEVQALLVTKPFEDEDTEDLGALMAEVTTV